MWAVVVIGVAFILFSISILEDADLHDDDCDDN